MQAHSDQLESDKNNEKKNHTWAKNSMHTAKLLELDSVVDSVWAVVGDRTVV